MNLKYGYGLSILLYYGLWYVNTVSGSCPNPESIAPCTCIQDKTESKDSKTETFVTCNEIPDANVLFVSARGMSNSLVQSFRVFNSRMGFLPSNMFLETMVSSVQVFHSPLTHFTEGNEHAFLGLETQLRELVLSNCQLNDSIKFQVFANLTELDTLDLSFNQITHVYKDWFFHPPKKLTYLSLKGNLIETIEDGAFSKMFQLHTLDLSENRLTSIQRSILPTPNDMKSLYLSYNDLETLPNDIFKDAKIMERIDLDYNKIRTLKSSVFEELWVKNSHLSRLDVLGNDILCDNSLCWYTLLGESSRNVAVGSCSDPDKLRGRRLRTLWPWDINCNETIYHGDMKLSYRAKV